MRKTSLRGNRPDRQNGYVLIEVIALLAVIAVSGIALLSAVSAGMRSVSLQTQRTVKIIEERNAAASAHFEDILAH